MNRFIFSFFIVVWVGLTQVHHVYALANDFPVEQGVWSPRKHQPAFVEPGQTFTVEVFADANLDTLGWTAQLRNEFKTWISPHVNARYTQIDHGTRAGWQLFIHVPEDVSPELLALHIRTPMGQPMVSARAVQVVPDMEQDFYIIHQSDQHLTDDAAVEPGGKASEKWGLGSKQALVWLAPVINLINPRMVLQTGDNMHLYNVADDWCGMDEAKVRVDRFFEGLAGFTVPTVLATGNHDLGWGDYVDIRAWRDYYTAHVGQRAFSIRMGSFYVLSSEWTANEFLDWARADYASSWQDPGVRYRLLVSHFYDGLDGWTTVATAEQPCDLLLVGHIHRSRVLQENPYRVLSVGTAQDRQRGAFFNFRNTPQGWVSDQAEAHAEGVNVHRLLGNYGAPTVRAEYEHENTGGATANHVRITNTLPHDFYDGRIRFVMKSGQYTVSGGEILSQYLTDQGDRTVVVVRVNITKESETQVSISKTSTS